MDMKPSSARFQLLGLCFLTKHRSYDRMFAPTVIRSVVYKSDGSGMGGQVRATSDFYRQVMTSERAEMDHNHYRYGKLDFSRGSIRFRVAVVVGNRG